MNKQEIETLLHQRSPYLMIDQVSALTETSIIAEKNHDGTEAHLQGHFPGAPIVPGAMLQEICTQAAGLLITKHYSPVKDYNSETTKGHALGVLGKVSKAKFIGFVKPEYPIESTTKLIEKTDSIFCFESIVKQNDIIKAKFQFTLINITDEELISS
jgi:3-hydroxyacyl-[acyl-carrier-protein] dehydratase